MKCARSSFFQCAAPYLVAMGRIGSAALQMPPREWLSDCESMKNKDV